MAPARRGEGADKDPAAFRTIREVSELLGVPQHVLRFWETRFPELKPLQRGGNRRYYRPADVAFASALHKLLHQDGYTVKGVRKLIADYGAANLVALASGDPVTPRRAGVVPPPPLIAAASGERPTPSARKLAPPAQAAAENEAEASADPGPVRATGAPPAPADRLLLLLAMRDRLAAALVDRDA